MKPFNQTKIICTIGPASDSYEVFSGLVKAGMNVMRMNFSHGTHEQHLDRMKMLDKVNTELGTHVAALLDTKGPEIRTHLFRDGRVTVTEGSKVTIHNEEIEGDENNFSITYKELYKDIKKGDCVLVDDGYLELEVTNVNKEKQQIITKAKNTHDLKNRKGINVPGVVLNLDFEFPFFKM